MKPNPFLKKLGFSDNDRAVIVHTDDIGMCHASVQAFKDLWAFGTITSGAVMVPCPWFPATAQMCRENPEIDMGVHATLNAEWESYRWGPVSTREAGSGLMDEAGYFHQWHPGVYQNAKPEAVAVEVNAQIEKALAAGIDGKAAARGDRCSPAGRLLAIGFRARLSPCRAKLPRGARAINARILGEDPWRRSLRSIATGFLYASSAPALGGVVPTVK
jgi:hypothetical protein